MNTVDTIFGVSTLVHSPSYGEGTHGKKWELYNGAHKRGNGFIIIIAQRISGWMDRIPLGPGWIRRSSSLPLPLVSDGLKGGGWYLLKESSTVGRSWTSRWTGFREQEGPPFKPGSENNLLLYNARKIFPVVIYSVTMKQILSLVKRIPKYQ